MSEKHEEGLLRHGTLLLVAQQVGNASVIGFVIVCGHFLSDSQYGVLTPLLNIILFMAYPVDALRTAFAHFSARLAQENRIADLRSLLRQWVAYLAVVALLILGGFALCGPWIMKAMHLEDSTLLAFTALGVAGTLFLPMVVGSLQGMQAFRWFVGVSQSWGLVRLSAAVLLFLIFKPSALQAIAGQVAGVAFCVLLGTIAIRSALGKGVSSGVHVPGVLPYALRSFPILVGFSVLMTFDAILVRIFLPDDIDMYSKASQIGRSVIFFAQPVVMALFPKVASAGVTSSSNWKNLFRALIFTSLLISPLMAGVMLFPKVPVILLFGSDAVTPELLRYVRLVILAMSPLSIVFLLMNFELAQHRFKLAAMTLAGAAVFAGGVCLYHPGLWTVVLFLGAGSLVTLVGLLIGTFARTRA